MVPESKQFIQIQIFTQSVKDLMSIPPSVFISPLFLPNSVLVEDFCIFHGDVLHVLPV